MAALGMSIPQLPTLRPAAPQRLCMQSPHFAVPLFEPSPDSELGRAVQHVNAHLSTADALSDNSPANMWRQQALSKALG